MICELMCSIFSLGVTSNQCCTFKDKTGICHGFVAMNPAVFGDAKEIKEHLSRFLQELRESPKAEGQERIYTHGEKEILAEKDRMENGIQVNDNTMLELAELCQYLGMDFSQYFEDYEVAENKEFFAGY